ncbi:TonB-dependent receptor domain-containing protein [Rhodobacter sp. 24-YEA-8]|uniref:TonB-dependent receptor domain-containing protein n=1 Tax=Rhodobacter sp. 24-YEA-8 TaxID=1884310 RepID=UPI00089AEBF1|nr:TonB-dependent receptor [Rhodobacter sp. 24-YEA-8]SEB88001.1 hemoglobin/transferrin/lactoferrin receptor protein [Rhodobacter sp. 24-YEA-8]
MSYHHGAYPRLFSTRFLALLLGSSILAQYPLSVTAQTTGEDETSTATPHNLGTIFLTGEGLTLGVAGDAVYDTPAPVSAISGADILGRYSGNAQTALRAIPGVFSRQQANQPGIEVNIRGMSGYGRVTAMIDGVPQTFKNIGGHEASGGSMLYVHPELTGAVEVVRGPVSGAHGSGTLSGAANFRTLAIDDVVLEGETRGGMLRLKGGSNGYDQSGMLAYGQRFTGLWGGEGEVNVMAAIAHTSQSDYENGDGIVVAGKGASNSPKGGLVKFEVKPNSEHTFAFGTRWYRNQFINSNYNWDIDNQTDTLSWKWRPDNQWINLDLELFHNEEELNYRPGSTGGYTGRRTADVTKGASLTNHANVDLSNGVNLDLTFGVSWQQNDFRTYERRGGNHPGTLDKSSLFSEAVADFGRWSLIGGLRYDHWEVSGTRTAPANEYVERSGGEVLPKLGLSFDLTPEIELYGTYSHTFRPPSSHEVFYANVPFNTGVGSSNNNNLDLKPELSKGVDLGVNWRRDGLFSAEDQVRLKVGYFNNRIKNYIVNDLQGGVVRWVNTDGTVKSHGVEIEGSYDAGLYYANIGYSDSKTDDVPTGFGTGGGNGEGSIQPDRVATVDFGVRLLDQRLQLGAQYRYVGTGKEAEFFNGWQETAAYDLWDLYGSYKVNDTVQAFFSVENITDKTYGYAGSGLNNYRSESGRGRTFIVGMTARF